MMSMLLPEQKKRLEELAKLAKSAAERRRAQLLLLYDKGLSTSAVAEEVDLSPSRVRYWRRAFQEKGLGVFPSEEGRGIDIETAHERLEPQASAPESATKTPTPKTAVSDSAEVTPAHEVLTPPAEGPPQEATPSESPGAPLTLDTLRETHHPDARHASHARELAEDLFNMTHSLHEISEDRGRLLSAAAYLHDLLVDETSQADPKASARQILSQPVAGLSTEEQQVVALLVRFQRGKTKGFQVPNQSPLDRQQALILLSLLRISINLDASQSQSTRLVDFKTTPHTDYIVVSGDQAAHDAAAAQRWAKLWRKALPKRVRVITEEMAQSPAFGSKTLPFPEPMKNPGIEPDDSLTEAGRKILRYHFAEMLQHEDGTKLGEDIEELHDMRVAVRRMRVAFEIFANAFDAKVIKGHLKGLRAIGRTLGQVRDLDVFMEKANQYLETLPAEKRAGLEPLFKAWQDQREISREKMFSFLEGDKYLTFLHEFNLFVNTPGAGRKSDHDDYHSPHLVRHIAPVMIYTRLGGVRAYEQVLDNASIEQLHELRIEFKKLRYTMEFLREVLGAEVENVIEDIKVVQDHLGDLNDADVACDILNQFLAGWEARQQVKPLVERENPEPIVAYLAYRHDERHRLMVTFNVTWEQFNRPDLLQAIALAVSVL